MGIGSGNIGLVNMPTIPSCTFFAKLERCDIFGRIQKISTHKLFRTYKLG